jgi:hypothetical protein
MATAHSALSKKITLGYWKMVREILCSRYQLSLVAARRGIKTYQTAIANAKIGDEIYHAPVEESAKGIYEGGYTTESKVSISRPSARKSLKKTI